MKIYNSFLFLILLVTINMCCNNSRKSIVKCALFLNPGQAFYSNKVHIKAKLNNSLILDTILTNKRVDNSEFLKCLSFDKSHRQKLSIDVNGKKKVLYLKGGILNCANVFIGINDYYLLQRRADKIEGDMKLFGLDVNYRTLLDSLRLNAKNNEYDSISVNIKTDRCLCK